ncbi:hypothetical protein SAMN05192575_11166 [Nocardioides alpinus]|uniref:DUF7144 domain-containing protein n=1 Tax=Nocardioides alpinus TaxID=748909 RepID=A0A1I1AXR4_9ACTN|nr:hypothetical protein [Nocardioides alpinus]PKH40938.1 hypothetical protein CXG46_10790 [Nocardioides alpinus]SFB42196.1 hypothetical protein SAMN05192575_11166 [Nocardioides alpinus]
MSTSSERAFQSTTAGIVAQGATAFAGIMLATASFLGILQGIAAISADNVYVDTLRYTYEFDLTLWGWIHLMLGIAGVAVGIGILMGKVWALVAGIVMAVLSVFANFAFLPQYPLWSIVIIALDVFVIWALCAQVDQKV